MNNQLFIVSGLPGTGKTTVARKIAEQTSASLLQTDVIRRELFKDRHYTPEETQRTYDEMFARASSILRERKNVVLDATFYRDVDRARVKKVAGELDSKLIIIEVICSDGVVKKRLEERSGNASEAKFEQYLQYKNLFEPISEKHIVIDNSGSLNDTDELLSKLELMI